MTAGSWIIGTQGIIQGTYETFAQAARVHFKTDGDPGKDRSYGGLGAWVALNPWPSPCRVCLAVEVDEHRLIAVWKHESIKPVTLLRQSVGWEARSQNTLSVGLGNAAEVFPGNFAPWLYA